MAELKADVLVLGAGMVSVGAALHLQKRGRDTVLIDRHELAGEETSYGNGGLIECASVFPCMFPRAADPGPGRAGAAEGAQAVSIGRAGRCQALEGRAALSAGHAAGDRHGALPSRAVVRFRPPAPRPDARTGDRPAAGGNDDRRDPVCRYHPFRGGTVWLTMGGEWGVLGAVFSLRDSASHGDTAASHQSGQERS
jgi:hypothetical protein